MGKRPFRPATGPFGRAYLQRNDATGTISRETADRLFIGMMRDQDRFGVRRSLVGSRMAAVLSDFREALSSRPRSHLGPRRPSPARHLPTIHPTTRLPPAAPRPHHRVNP